MIPFVTERGQVALLDQNNVDTDAILPKQFMKSIKRSGFGQFAFDEWRYLDAGELGMDCSKRPLNPDFEPNQQKYQGASILVTRANFGCGSSREHAPWALLEYGFRTIIAESFAEIFRGNCLKNGILTVTLDKSIIDQIFVEARSASHYYVCVDLESGTVSLPDGVSIPFKIEPNVQEKLLNGWDDIELTLKHAEKIRTFEASRWQQLPWLAP
ncbi:3-isopropylmalate dehydratase small subunit [Pseudomonas poae]|uniref:3-isopropylmalate dehydratase small subunit n=1 Tax=Pseudomonas poae TaxID=200451 RepID=A0A423FAS9_9PSED|nr:3-isopropylmalate dehydratase small subunit [Pseudomonas poae]ROM53408.1 3-isopropylmalate dehydratase small subunit [Pseudomonas poae]